MNAQRHSKGLITTVESAALEEVEAGAAEEVLLELPLVDVELELLEPALVSYLLTKSKIDYNPTQ